MKPSRPLLLAIAFAAIALLGVALYLQHGLNMLPCPLCVMQRYAFTAVALICLVAYGLPARVTCIGAGFGLLAALTGGGIAIYHVWLQAHPAISCGIDPLETALNKVPTAELLPFLYYAEGMCSDNYPPILGLSIPQWSLVWFAIFAIALGWLALRRKR